MLKPFAATNIGIGINLNKFKNHSITVLRLKHFGLRKIYFTANKLFSEEKKHYKYYRSNSFPIILVWTASCLKNCIIVICTLSNTELVQFQTRFCN